MRMPVSFAADVTTFQIWGEMKKHGNRSQIMRSLIHGWAKIHEKELTSQSEHLSPSQSWQVRGMPEPRCNPHLTTGRCPKCWTYKEYLKVINVRGEWIYQGGEEECP